MRDDLATETLLRVPSDPSPSRVDAWLAAQMPDISRSRIQALIRQGKVTVDGAAVKPRHELLGGEALRVLVPPPEPALPEPQDLPLCILYEDEHLAVIDKPPGLTVHPGAAQRADTLANALLHRYPDIAGVGGAARPGIVHRLDKMTSGVLCVARTEAARRRLAAQLAERTMHRTYLAWVVGPMPDMRGLVDAPIGRHPRHRTRMAAVGAGRAARTHWWALARAPGLTRVGCRLETGRTHQIRVHLAHIGHPVCGDPEYGYAAARVRQGIPPGFPAIVQAVARASRQLLHAWRLELDHPADGRRMCFEAPAPEDFAAFEAAVAPWTEPTACAASWIDETPGRPPARSKGTDHD